MDEYKYLADMHTHTVASGHAYNTILEMSKKASEIGLEILGITEHSMTMPGTCHEFYFQNLKSVGRNEYGVDLCLGVELNIIDYMGNVDMNPALLNQMDVVIASIHGNIGYTVGTKQENTSAILGAIKNPIINIIGHPDDSRIPLEYNVIVDAAKQYNKLLEINNNSLSPDSFRLEPKKNDIEILKLCKEKNVPIIIGSDAHSVEKVGLHNYAMEIIDDLDFPYELIMNFNTDKLKKYVNKYKREMV